jgi:hypothetical protein
MEYFCVYVKELCVKELCVKELCVTKLCDKVVCVKEGRAGRTADGRRTKELVGGRECTTEKQEPHTKMWGKNVENR